MLLSNNGFTPRAYTRQVLKINNIAPVLGNAVAENTRLQYAVDKGFTGIQLYGLYGVFGTGLETDLEAFILKARQVYGLRTVGCIMGIGTAGFASALAYNAGVPAISRFDDFNKENEFWNYFRVDFTITNGVNGFNYQVTLDGTTYSYLSATTDKAVIAAGLAAACAPSGFSINVLASDPFTFRVRDTSSIYSSFTYSNSANVSNENIVETYPNWIASLQWLAPQLSGNEFISAYVANPANNWGVTEAEDMVQVIDIYEGTNYTTVPNSLQVNYRDRQLIYLAQAANNVGVIQEHYPIFSAEDDTNPSPCGEDNFMGTYLQSNSIALANSTWLAQYQADAFANKSNLHWVGYNYFVYSCLSLYVP